MKKFIGILLLTAAAVAGWYYYQQIVLTDKDQQQNAWDSVDVGRGSIRLVVEATGRIIPELEVEIKCKASGEVIKLPVDVSDTVKKGELLVQLDPENEKRLIERGEVALAVSQARLSQAKLKLKATESDLKTERMRTEADLLSAKAKKQETIAKLERVKHLLEKKIASPQELDVAQAEHAKAMSDLESALARVEDIKTWDVQIDSLDQEIKIAEAQVLSDKLSLSDARQRLEDTTVLAPIDGVVAERDVQVGQIIASGINNVGGGTTVMKLADLSHIYVLVSVDESDIGSIKVDQQSEITVDSYPNVVFPGKVVRVATKGTVEANVVTFEVKVEIGGPNHHLLKPEMTANVKIVASRSDNALLVPVAAIQRNKEGPFVSVMKNEAPEERMVKTGISDGEFMEIISGLSEGEKVVIPEEGSLGRWMVKDKKNGTQDKKKKNDTHRNMMRMRVMSGKMRR